jgi:uncharacterized protein (TIGR02118 family)
MDKVIAIVRSASGTIEPSRREALWPEIEAGAVALSASVPHLSGLVVSRVIRPFAEGDPLVALIEVWDDAPDADALIELALPASLRQDAVLTVTTAICSEIVFKRVADYARDGSPWTVKLAGTAFRRDDFELEQFYEYWTNTHAPIGGTVPSLGGYTVSRVKSGQLGEESADALIEQWYVDEQAFDLVQESEQAQAAWNDVGNYAKTTGTAFWLLSESVIVEPPITGPGTLET